MDYEKFITSIEQSESKSNHHELYNFALLKVARHDQSNLLAKQHFEPETKARLKIILRRLNKIHQNQTYLEKEMTELERSFK